MAVKTVVSGGGNWSSAATWSPAGVPITNDSVVLNATSGDLNVDIATATINGLNFTGYPAGKTITFNTGFGINVYGTINLGTPGTYSIGGTGGYINIATGSASVTSNGVVFPHTFVVSNAAGTLTLNDILNTQNLTVGNATGAYTINNNSINVLGDLKIGASVANTCNIEGTTNIYLKGAGTWTAVGTTAVGVNLFFDTGVNSFTCTGNLGFGKQSGAATMTYLSGNINATAANLTFNRSSSTSTLNCTSAITWGAITINQSVITLSLTSDLYANSFISNVGGTINTSTSNYMYVSGNCTSAGTQPVGGTSKIILTDTGTLQGLTGGSGFIIDIDINAPPASIRTIPGNFRYWGKTFRYISGIVNTSGSTLNIISGTTTLDTAGMSWNNINMVSSGTTITNLSNLNLTGNLSCSTTSIINGFTTFIGGGLSQTTSTLSGTSTLYFNGTGTISQTATAQLGSSIQTVIINTTGLITFGSVFRFQGALLDIQSGPSTVNALTNNTIFTHTANNITLNCANITWPGASFISSTTVTLNSNFKATNLTISAAVTFNLNTINIGGNFTINNSAAGSSAVLLNGTGTWSNALNSVLKLNTLINTSGTITITGILGLANMTLTYAGGTVVTTGSILRVGGGPGAQPVTLDTKGSSNPNSSTLSINGINWDNFRFDAANAVTLLSDLRVCGNIDMTAGADTLNSSNGSKLYLKGSFIPTFNGGKTLSGTAEMVLDGVGSITNNSAATMRISGIKFTVSGIYNITGISLFELGLNSTLQLLGNGKLRGNLINVFDNCNINNADKMEIANIAIDNGSVITMNKFFSGTPNKFIRVYSSDNAIPPLNGNIVFTEEDEQISKFTKISRCNITQKGRLLCLTPGSNKGNNTGIRYVNQSPNGVPKNKPSIVSNQPYGLSTVQDPSLTRTFLTPQT